MNILFTICGRAGSKGVRGKNARDFLGLPLVWYSLAAIKLYIESHGKGGDTYGLCASTDSEDLIKLIERTGMPTHVIRRDASLAGGEVPKVSVIKDCLLKEQERTGKKFDMVVDLDITSPLRRTRDIETAVGMKKSRPEADCVYSVTEARRNPMFNMVKEEDGFSVKAMASNFTARQQAPAFYDMNGSIYAYSPGALTGKEPTTFFNRGNAFFRMPDTGILDIDSEEDYRLMQAVAAYLYENDPDYGEIAEAAAGFGRNS